MINCLDIFQRCTTSSTVSSKLNAFFGTDVNCIKSVHQVSWVIHNGQKFIPRQCVIAFGELHNLPEFGELQHIWVTNKEVEMDTIQRIYLGLKMYKTVRFDEHVLGYAVCEPTIAQGLELVFIENIFVPFPLHLYNNGQESFVIVPYDLMDVIRSKMMG